MTNPQVHDETRRMVQLAAQICEDKKGIDTRILELDPIDSGLADFFLITSASNDRQATAIADEIELRLKHEFGVYAHSVEGRRAGEWILLDYVDFVVHVFLAERRDFYDIERLRKSARPFTPAEFDAELKSMLAAKTVAVRKKATSVQKKAAAKKAPAKTAKAKPAAKKAPAKKVVAKKTAVKKAPAKATRKTAVKKAVVKKAAVKKATKRVATVAKPKSALKKAPAKKAAAKKTAARKTTAKKAVAKKAPKKAAAKKKSSKR